MTELTGLECIGTFDEDVTTLASRVFQQVEHVPRLVWAEDDGKVYLGPVQEKECVPEKWIAGTSVGKCSLRRLPTTFAPCTSSAAVIQS